MRPASRVLILAFLIGAPGGCSQPTLPALNFDVTGSESSPFESGVRLSAAGQLVRSATSEGLVALDEQGRVIPALADRWIVTDDGLSYIFRLRDGLWPNGDPITGETVREAVRQALEGMRRAPLGQEFASVSEVRAMAGRVVEIRLEHAVPDLLQLLAQPELGLIHKGIGGGPMSLRREGPLAILEPIPPARLGLPQSPDWSGKVRSIRLHAVSADLAARRFAEGDVDMVLGGRFDSLAQAQRAAGLSQRALVRDPVMGLFGLAVIKPAGPLASPDLREALAMAIDREALGVGLALGRGWTPTTRLVLAANPENASVFGERWADRSVPQRKADAAGRIARWKGRHGAIAPLRIALPDGPGSDAMFSQIAADWGAVGVPVQRVKSEAQADVQLLDLVERYPRPDWYLNQLSCAARRALCSAAADQKMAEARVSDQPERRAALLVEAERLLTDANVFIPLGTPIRWSLVRGGIAGFAPNSAGFHPLAPMAIGPD